MTRRQSSHHRPSSRAAALLASASLVVVGVQSGTAGAVSEREDGATALVLSAAERTAAITGAQAEAAQTARAIGLSGREGLVVRDVVKGADGTVHTRYERTCEDLPVLGGDLVVHRGKGGARSTAKATGARTAVPGTAAADAHYDGSSADYWSKSVGRLDVHYFSGPANHFFYLLSEGSGAKTLNGVSYDSPTADGSTVTGIGRTKAYQSWYKALSTYMTSSTDYAGARTATLEAAGDLYGTGGAEYAAVAAAWTAVNVK
ncbi:M4 family metallopeptidase [Streptomyces sp. NPDC048577]|uniref:M4 family metallopeptidase n=1 Tax=Streptomyces sp. NPDC048577 TaxID=3157209 RepID=UPI0034482CCB